MASLKAKRLRIGFLVDDGVVKVQPPIARAVREVVAALKAAGYEGIYHWNTPPVGFSNE
jgi:amidase